MQAETATASKRGTRPHSIAFYVILAAGLYAMIHAYSLLSPVLLSLLLIILITLAVNPIVSRLRNWTVGRKRATGLILAGILTLGGLAVWSAVDPMKDAVATLSQSLPTYWQRLQKPLIKLEQHAALSEESLQEEVSAEIARESPEADETASAPQAIGPPSPEPPSPEPPSPERPGPAEPSSDDEDGHDGQLGEGTLRSGLIAFLQDAFQPIKEAVFNTTQMLIVLLTVFFGVTFTLMNPRPIFGALFSVVPACHHAQTRAIMERIATFVPRWAGAVLISMLTIGVLFFLLMWPIFGFPDAIMLGLIACLLSAIPFLGPLLSLIPALLLAIGEGGMTPLWVVLAYLAVQALESNVILPLVMSHGIELHPLAVIFSMLLSVAAFGVLGVIIAAPLVAIIGILHEELYRKHLQPGVTDEDLDRLARCVLLEKRPAES